MSSFEIYPPFQPKDASSAAQPYKTVVYATEQEAIDTVARAGAAHWGWNKTPLVVRENFIDSFLNHLQTDSDEFAEELSHLIGRPKKQNLNELRGLEERARYMMGIAQDALADWHLPPKEGFKRYVTRESLGVVFVIAPWNYPYLCMVNTVIPALLAGNTVIVKQAPQTFPCAERFTRAFEAAGLPKNVFQHLHATHEVVAECVIKNPAVQFVQFTGSVRGGRQVSAQLAGRFIASGFELGGKDPAYVRADADIAYAAENIVDGAMYNSGQSCCAVERVYVHESVYDAFVEKCVEVVKGYKLGHPLEEGVNIGPVISVQAADNIRAHIQDAIDKGASSLIPATHFPAVSSSNAYVAPTLLTNVNHSMTVMTEETFGPVLPIMRVTSDEEAIQLMNDSVYGLTASLWSEDVEVCLQLGDRLETGTVFMNRCDYLDPGLCWTGVKDSGVGVSLSKFGFDALTRPKSYHLRVAH